MDAASAASGGSPLPVRARFARGPRRVDAEEFAIDVVVDSTVRCALQAFLLSAPSRIRTCGLLLRRDLLELLETPVPTLKCLQSRHFGR
jgi:hypothetical protein